jgi:thioredoxin-related protein
MTPPFTLQQTTDLQQLGKQVAATGKPLLLMFSQHDCAFCIKLKREVIEPMLRNSAYRERLIMRELMIDEMGTLVNFSGEATTGSELFERYGMVVTPTIVLVDSTGREIAKRQTGVNTIEMYPWYLDQAIEAAVAVLAR